MPRQLQSGLYFATCSLLVSYVLATALVEQTLIGPVDYWYLITEARSLWIFEREMMVQIGAIFLICALGAFAFGVHSASEALTKQGTSSWQSRWQMRRNGLLGKPGKGFVLARTSGPKGRGRYITSDAHPNALIVAPTGAGKGVGFVYPNLLTFEGSTVTLDIKGENYATTARTRAAMGDKIFKFAPVQFGEASYRYNPLERIGRLTTYAQITYELRKIATLFLQADGAGEWLNGAIQLFTADLRRGRASIYFIVADADLKPLAGLVRLFFNELVARLQKDKPTEDEPHHVMIILDEFHRLGKMSEVAEAMTTIRGFNGRIAIITQTIPKLDEIYSREERLSIQGGAGLKLYMTPSEEMTIEDLSKACGMTTKRTVSKSRRVGMMERATVSERTEERPLLTEDEARRLPRDAVIIIVNGEQPVKAKRIVHYEDPTFTRILKAQDKLSWDDIERDLLSARVAKVERQVAGATKGSDERARSAPDQADLTRLAHLVDEAIKLLERVAALPDAKPIDETPNEHTEAEPSAQTESKNPPEEDTEAKSPPASRQLSLLPETTGAVPKGDETGAVAS